MEIMMWTCRIGPIPVNEGREYPHPTAFLDDKLRAAMQTAFDQHCGAPAEFIESDWEAATLHERILIAESRILLLEKERSLLRKALNDLQK